MASVAPGGPAARAGLQRRRRAGVGQRAHAAQPPRLGIGQAGPRAWATPCVLVTRRGDRDRHPHRSSRATCRRVTAAQGDGARRTSQLVTVTPAIRAERGLRSEQGALIFGIAPRTARRHRAPRRATSSSASTAAASPAPPTVSACFERPAPGRGVPHLLRARTGNRLHRPGCSDDRRPLALAARHPLRLARHAAALGRAATAIGLWRRALAGARRIGAGARPRHPRGGARRDARPPRRRRPRPPRPSTSAASATTSWRTCTPSATRPRPRGPFIHLGATSAFVTDNADLMVMRDGLRLVLGRLRARSLGALGTFAERHAGDALPRLHPLPAGAAHHGRQARHALDAGLRAGRRGDLPPPRDAALPRLQGHHRHAGVLPRALRRRPRQGARARPPHRRAAWASPQTFAGHRADLPAQGRQRRCSTCCAASRSPPPRWRPTSGCCSTRASSSSRSRRSRSARAPWPTSGTRCAPSASAALARFVISLQANARADRRQPVARAHARRQRQPPAHPARGVPRHRRDPRSSPTNIAAGLEVRRAVIAAARGRADALHGHRALADARRVGRRRPAGAARGDPPAQPGRGGGREPAASPTTCWSGSAPTPPSRKVPAACAAGRARSPPLHRPGRASRWRSSSPSTSRPCSPAPGRWPSTPDAAEVRV